MSFLCYSEHSLQDFFIFLLFFIKVVLKYGMKIGSVNVFCVWEIYYNIMSYIKQRAALLIFTYNFRMDHSHHMEEIPFTPNFGAFHSKSERSRQIYSLKYTTALVKGKSNKM